MYENVVGFTDVSVLNNLEDAFKCGRNLENTESVQCLLN